MSFRLLSKTVLSLPGDAIMTFHTVADWRVHLRNVFFFFSFRDRRRFLFWRKINPQPPSEIRQTQFSVKKISIKTVQFFRRTSSKKNLRYHAVPRVITIVRVRAARVQFFWVSILNGEYGTARLFWGEKMIKKKKKNNRCKFYFNSIRLERGSTMKKKKKNVGTTWRNVNYYYCPQNLRVRPPLDTYFRRRRRYEMPPNRTRRRS